MARRGRTRKAGKREPNGKPQRESADVRREADRIDPTPEMARKKAAVGGAEVGDVVALLPLTHAQREAIAKYEMAKAGAGFGPPRVTANYSDPMIARGSDEECEERERKARDFYAACERRVAEWAGERGHRAICELVTFRRVAGNMDDLRKGANALARFFGLERSEAA